MTRKVSRKPIANFFIKRDLQFRLIRKIVSAVLFATAIFAATMLITYHIKYADDAFYQVTLNNTEPQIGDRLDFVSIILPSVVISSIVNIALAFLVGLYASRKYAVPIFKLEQWATLLNTGHFTARLRFREKEEMKELCERCNELAENMRGKFSEIQTAATALSQKSGPSAELNKILETLQTLGLDKTAVEVRTSVIQNVSMEEASQV
jgi:methyl-accepting chemotaxis protein